MGSAAWPNRIATPPTSSNSMSAQNTGYCRALRPFTEWINIIDAPYFANQDRGGARRLLRYEEYIWTGKSGVTASF